MPYRAYHSDLKIQYASKNIPFDLLKPVPRSTRQRWKNKNSHNFWKPYPTEHNNADLMIRQLKAENLYLRKKIKALFYLVQVYRMLMRSFKINIQHAQVIRPQVQQLFRFCAQHGLDKITWRYLPFSYKQWTAWTRQPLCPASLQGKCRKTYAQQLAIVEQKAMQAAAGDPAYQHWPLSSIYYQLLRQLKIHCSISTFYKYCRLMNITAKKVKAPKKYYPLLADAPLKVLHQDITVFRTVNGVKHYLYVIRDNFSRALLACKVATEYNSAIAKQTLEEVLTRFDLLDKEGTLITDDGMENKGKLEGWLKQSCTGWRKIIAQFDIIQSNSMAEAINKTIKHRFLYTQPIADTQALIAVVQRAFEYNSWPNAQLFGYTPNEVLQGAIPDKHRFKAQIQTARQIRMESNRNFACDLVCQT